MNKDYKFNDIISVVKRENNSKRSFLFLNKLQSKYVPSDPRDTIRLFKTLGYNLAKKYKEEKILIVAFAETATAIGAYVAECFPGEVYYLHTTRENLNREDLLCDFQEEHSHATSHYIYSKNPKYIKECERIIFVDDELTTGKTICNFIDALLKEGKVNKKAKFVAASLINCMEDERIELLKSKGIGLEYLYREKRNWSNITWQGEKIKDLDIESKAYNYEYIEVKGKIEIREGAFIEDYKRACNSLINILNSEYSFQDDEKNVLVLGTEECMYPAIEFAKTLKDKYKNKNIKSYAMSRSPIVPINNEGYPLFNRSKVKSFYDDKRKVFIYNIEKYDRVFIITDSHNLSEEAKNETVSALKYYGNNKIVLVRWVKDEV